MTGSNNRKLYPTFHTNILKLEENFNALVLIHFCMLHVISCFTTWALKKFHVIPHISATSSELSPQSSSPSQTQKCSLQRELLHKNSSALHIFPPGRMKRRKTERRKTERQKNECQFLIKPVQPLITHYLKRMTEVVQLNEKKTNEKVGKAERNIHLKIPSLPIHFFHFLFMTVSHLLAIWSD